MHAHHKRFLTHIHLTRVMYLLWCEKLTQRQGLLNWMHLPHAEFFVVHCNTAFLLQLKQHNLAWRFLHPGNQLFRSELLFPSPFHTHVEPQINNQGIQSFLTFHLLEHFFFTAVLHVLLGETSVCLIPARLYQVFVIIYENKQSKNVLKCFW